MTLPHSSSAHVSNHAARPAPAQAAHPSASTAGSSSSHAAFPAPPVTSTGGSASNLSAVGERAAPQLAEVAERGRAARSQATHSPPRRLRPLQTAATAKVKGDTAISSGAATRAFLRLGGWGAFPLAAAAAVAAEARARKRKRDEEESALRLGLDQWRHTGSVTKAPPADWEPEEASESPGPATHLVVSHRAKCPRPRGTGVGGKAAGAATKGPGSAGAGGEKQQRARRGLGLAQGRFGAPAVSHGLLRGRQWHCPSTEDVRRFRESETQRGLAGRQRDEAERQEEARHALITGRREVSMSREEVAAAVARGFKSAEGLVTSSLRGLGNRRGAALVDAANRSGRRQVDGVARERQRASLLRCEQVRWGPVEWRWRAEPLRRGHGLRRQRGSRRWRRDGDAPRREES